MAKYLRYYTEFRSLMGHVVRAEILQEANAAFVPEELKIGTGDAPLTIRWPETDKIAPVQGSIAQLVVNSSTDRQLTFLANILKASDVRLDIKRDGSLWWSGHLDSEPYEEPFTSRCDYDVTLTFSDFGILNRVPWSRTGRESYATILTECLTAAGINYGQLIEHISTQYAGENNSWPTIDFSELTLNNDNFYDEENKEMSCMEVLKGILQPFALRIIQRCGNIILYDLNAASALQATDVNYIDQDAGISYDAVYNDATVIFSPYCQDVALDGAVVVSDKAENQSTMVKTGYDPDTDERLDGFIVRYGSQVTAHGPTLENGAAYFDFVAQYSGSDAAGILWSWMYGDAALSSGTCRQRLQAAGSCFQGGNMIGPAFFIGQRIATSPSQYLNYVTTQGGVRSRYKLRINLDLLFDVRYNPFEDAGDYNEKSNYKTLTSKCGFVWVPVMVTLRDAPGGNALYHLENYRLITDSLKYSAAYGTRWVAGEGDPGTFFLAYYDHEDRKGKCGVGGWTTNRRCIGYYTGELPDSWATMPAGEYVDLPPCGGYLEMTLYSGFHIRNRDIVTSIYDLVRWVGYKDAAITLVKKNGLAIDMEDQEDIAYVNADAQESFSVDTIVGTQSPDVPAATGRGLIFRGGVLCEKFRRAGVWDRLEKLLLGTIYSQYAERKQKLTATVDLLEGFVLSDTPRTASKYLLVADTQNLADDSSYMTMTEFGPDEYQDIEYEQ